MDRTRLLNYISDTFNLSSYLEIGIEGDAGNFRSIKTPFKHSIDITPTPYVMQVISSDDYFRQLDRKFDLMFIDGDHYSGQVLKDIHNALNFISDDGYILCHDTMPYTEVMQIVPRETDGWCGDVWKAILRLRQSSDVYVQTLNADFGLTIIRKNKTMPKYTDPISETWIDYTLHREKFMNVLPEREFMAGLH